MVGWHPRLNGHEFEQNPEDSGGQTKLACCSPWGRKELDTTQQLNNGNIYVGSPPGSTALASLGQTTFPEVYQLWASF